jgi:hypothetical protein
VFVGVGVKPQTWTRFLFLSEEAMIIANPAGSAFVTFHLSRTFLKEFAALHWSVDCSDNSSTIGLVVRITTDL